MPATANTPSTGHRQSAGAVAGFSVPGGFIAILAAIALLFILGISCGALQDDNARIGDVRDGWVETLNNLIGRKPSIEFDELSSELGSCIQSGQLRIAPASACDYSIQENERSVREITLRLQSGASATVAVKQGDFSESGELTVAQPTAEFNVLPDDPATVEITCAGAQICRLSVE